MRMMPTSVCNGSVVDVHADNGCGACVRQHGGAVPRATCAVHHALLCDPGCGILVAFDVETECFAVVVRPGGCEEWVEALGGNHKMETTIAVDCFAR